MTGTGRNTSFAGPRNVPPHGRSTEFSRRKSNSGPRESWDEAPGVTLSSWEYYVDGFVSSCAPLPEPARRIAARPLADTPRSSPRGTAKSDPRAGVESTIPETPDSFAAPPHTLAPIDMPTIRRMKRFAIEHLPKTFATYHVSPVGYSDARAWLAVGDVTSLVRTTELIEAIGAGLGVTLEQAAMSMSLQPGDEALLLSLSFSVLLAWAEGGIVPLEDDWRCLLLSVQAPSAATPSITAVVVEDLTAGQAE